MKRLTAIGLSLFVASPSWATYSFVFNWVEQSPDTSTTAKDTSGCDLLVVAVTHGNAATPTLTDNKGNTWTGLTTVSDGSNRKVRFFYCQNPTVGSGHTFHPDDGLGLFATVDIIGFSGSTATPFDQENGNTGSNVATLATGSITPTQDNEVLIAAWGFQSFGGITTGTLDSSFNAVDFLTDGAYMGIKTAYLIQTTAASTNVTWTPGGGNIFGAATIASFKTTGGAVAATVCPPPYCGVLSD